jgi:hypothetical protein
VRGVLGWSDDHGGLGRDHRRNHNGSHDHRDHHRNRSWHANGSDGDRWDRRPSHKRNHHHDDLGLRRF